MRIQLIRILLIGLLAALLAGCGEDDVVVPEKADTNMGGRVTITDQTGKVWDITQAVRTYGMSKVNWGHGIGQHIITPINDPVMLGPQDRGYPADDFDDIVLGVYISGDARAYSIYALTSHEVVNDFVGGSYVSPVY